MAGVQKCMWLDGNSAVEPRDLLFDSLSGRIPQQPFGLWTKLAPLNFCNNQVPCRPNWDFSSNLLYIAGATSHPPIVLTG